MLQTELEFRKLKNVKCKLKKCTPVSRLVLTEKLIGFLIGRGVGN